MVSYSSDSAELWHVVRFFSVLTLL